MQGVGCSFRLCDNESSAPGDGNKLNNRRISAGVSALHSSASKPQKIFSDNATTFRAAAEAIQCTWEFNPPAAPWFGGFYERLVQSVKAPLQKVVGQALLHIQDLYTVLTEIYRMAQTTQWSPAILDFMKNVMSNISTCLA